MKYLETDAQQTTAVIVGLVSFVLLVFIGCEFIGARNEKANAAENIKIKHPPSMEIYSKQKYSDLKLLVTIDKKTGARYLIVSKGITGGVAIIELKTVPEKEK